MRLKDYNEKEYYDERSEAWQDSERGEDFAARLEAVQEVVAQVAELDAADTKKIRQNP